MEYVGHFLGGVLQLAIQIPALRRIAMLPRPSLDWRAAWADPGPRGLSQGVSVASRALTISLEMSSRCAAMRAKRLRNAASWVSISICPVS